MESLEQLYIVVLLIILAEVTYLVVRSSGRHLGKKQAGGLLIDTSVLMDGRIISIAKAGFLPHHLIVPRSVVGELQLLADTADHDKRSRARHGLDAIAELQTLPGVRVTILQDSSSAREGVDERLLALAKKHGYAICTIDYNLNKVATVEAIAVVNINELAQALRVAHLPGETFALELIQKGNDAHQAVGYLPDGTMVVVENASRQIGQTVEIEFIRNLQTAAGRMMFAKKRQPEQASHVQSSVAHAVNSRSPRKRQPTQRSSGTKQRRIDHESSLIDLVDKQK